MARVRTFAVGGLVAALLGVAGLWGLLREESSDLQWLSNRMWVERMPADKRDMVQVFTPLKVRGKQFGAVQRQSHYRVVADRFQWTLKGNKLRLGFPQDGHKVVLSARTWSCVGDAPKPFDLCLELERGDRRVVLYSREKWVLPREAGDDWEIDPAAELTRLPDSACELCVDGIPESLRQLGL